MKTNSIEKLEEKLILKNDRLKIAISKPGQFYARERFDWTGFITDVVLDDKHQFCATHLNNTCEYIAGRGLCNEFGLRVPVGSKEIALGQKYPKIGIGILPRVKDELKTSIKFSEILPFPMSYEEGENNIVFTVNPVECAGYAVKLEKKISLNNNFLFIDYKLENIGTKTIETEEYCHNFVLLDDKLIGPEYELQFPFEIDENIMPSGMIRTNNGLTWDDVPTGVYYFRHDIDLFENSYWWKLIHKSGAGLREFGNFKPDSFALWGKEHVVSPEVFININLEPGKIKCWKRQYEFFCD